MPRKALDTDIPLIQRFPALRNIPRVSLCTLPSPVQRVEVDGVTLWIKRDDLNAPVCGGNKVRALEFLLAGVRPDDTMLTVGGEGSTHVLATAVHAARLGARTVGVRWRHDMNPTAERVAAQIAARGVITPVHPVAVIALLRAQLFRLSQPVRYIPPGGSTPLGALAQVNAGLELAEQLRTGEAPIPGRVVLPLGSGGTMAGLALGLAIAEVDTVVIGVQVAPALVANRVRVMRLIGRTAHLIERVTGQRIPRPRMHRLGVVRGAYGGAYGRSVPTAVAAANRLRETSGIVLDQTYSAKAFAVALSLARSRPEPTLFWNTFDGRVL